MPGKKLYKESGGGGGTGEGGMDDAEAHAQPIRAGDKQMNRPTVVSTKSTIARAGE